MTVKNLDHFNIRASEPLLEELREFYCDLIGLSEGFRPPFEEAGYWLYAGKRAILHLSVAGANESQLSHVESTLNHVALQCSDKSVFEKRLNENAIPYEYASVPGTTVEQIFLKDPAGNGIELSFAGTERTAEPLCRIHMPTGFEISLDEYVGRLQPGKGYVSGERRIPDDFGPPQSMRGFEETYRNIIDYIVRITYRIWEDRDVEYIGATYSDRSRVFDDYGLQLGSKKIISDTHHTTGAFSNIRLIADDIIWAGNDEIGYHTSHRTIIRGTNDGDSKYGPATNKDVDVLVIANCVALDNEIFLEHVLYNNSSLIQQLGLDLDDMARSMVANPAAGWPRDELTWLDLRSATSPSQAISASEPIAGFDVDAFARDNFNAIWNRRDDDAMDRNYDPGFQFSGPTDRSFDGVPAYREFLHSLQEAFSDIELQVDEVYWMGNDHDGYLSSERWSATARHTTDGLYGPATGTDVQIWGITQHQIVNGKIVREWMLFNELDLVMQIAAAR